MRGQLESEQRKDFGPSRVQESKPGLFRRILAVAKLKNLNNEISFDLNEINKEIRLQTDLTERESVRKMELILEFRKDSIDKKYRYYRFRLMSILSPIYGIMLCWIFLQYGKEAVIVSLITPVCAIIAAMGVKIVEILIKEMISKANKNQLL